MDNNLDVKIQGPMPKYLSVFSAEGVTFKEDLDFRNCVELAFLIYKEAGVSLALVDSLDYVKVHGEEPARGAEAKRIIKDFIDADRQQAMKQVETQVNEVSKVALELDKNQQ